MTAYDDYAGGAGVAYADVQVYVSEPADMGEVNETVPDGLMISPQAQLKQLVTEPFRLLQILICN